jgi:hypothetical protein
MPMSWPDRAGSDQEQNGQIIAQHTLLVTEIVSCPLRMRSSENFIASTGARMRVSIREGARG